MGTTSRLRGDEILSVMRLLADVAALKGDPPAQRQLLIDGLNELVGTNQSFFYVADGWRPDAQPHFAHTTLSRDHDPVFLKYMAEFGVKFPLQRDPFCDISIGHNLTFGSWTWSDVLPDIDACRRYKEIMDIRQAGRVHDGVVAMFRHADDGGRVVGVGMHRLGKSSTRLRPKQRAMAELAVAEIRRLVELGHLALPPIEPQPLPPRLVQILDRLLSGQSAKQIARELGLSVWTIREHMHRLYQRLGVTGREELMARFVVQQR
jgi:DNA-binding CsgD family transcriptional regulator